MQTCKMNHNLSRRKTSAQPSGISGGCACIDSLSGWGTILLIALAFSQKEHLSAVRFTGKYDFGMVSFQDLFIGKVAYVIG